MWNELCYHYNKGVNLSVYSAKRAMSMKPYIDKERHKQVALNWIFKYMMPFGGKMPAYFYFQTFSKMNFPKDMEKPSFKLK